MPKISIIVPVYNSEQFLSRCIDSILEQDYKDFELLLVDDGSKDSSLAICQSYAVRDPRVKALHKANGGASSARNAGLEAASGEWITFADSDDYVYHTYLSDMLSEATEHGSDIVVTGCDYDINGVRCHRTYADARLDKDHIIEVFTKYDVYRASCVWGKLFKASIIKDNIRFDEGIAMNEDLLFSAECFMRANAISLLSKNNYYYDMHTDSLCRYVYSPESELKCFNLFIELQKKLEKHFGVDNLNDVVEASKYLQRAINALYDGKYSHSERIKRLKAIKFDKRYIDFKSTNTKEKVYHLCIKHKAWQAVDYISSKIIPNSGIRFKSKA